MMLTTRGISFTRTPPPPHIIQFAISNRSNYFLMSLMVSMMLGTRSMPSQLSSEKYFSLDTSQVRSASNYFLMSLMVSMMLGTRSMPFSQRPIELSIACTNRSSSSFCAVVVISNFFPSSTSSIFI